MRFHLTPNDYLYLGILYVMNYTDILVNIRKIIRSVNLESKRIEKEYGISIPQLLCLQYLSKQSNYQATPKAIKDYLQLNASTVTGIIARLEKKGLLAKLPKTQDRRVSPVILTANGADLIERTPEPMHDQLKSKLNQLSATDLENLQEAFHTIIQFLDIKHVDAAPIITSGTDIQVANTTDDQA
jgi:DNA-binding MarR family transcriptional regulator